MQTNTATKFLPIVTDKKKLEVSLTDSQAVIKLSTWTEDLGWCCQKTLSVDNEMLDDLHSIIASARYKLNSKNVEAEQNVKPKKVIKFPSLS